MPDPVPAPATGDPAPLPTNPAPGPNPPLGEAGEKALEAWKERAKSAENKTKELSAAATERDELRAQLEKLQEQSKSEQEKQLEKAIKEAEERVRKDTESTVNVRLVKAEVRAQAAGALQDPEDAVRYLDLANFKVGADGEVDGKAIRAAVDDLIKERPYLAGKAQQKGDIDQGARKSGAGDNEVQPGIGRLMAGYSKTASS